jgi:hypothetical protein
LVDRILIDASQVDLDDDMSIWEGADTFLRFLAKHAHLDAGEFPDSLNNLNKVSFYIAQVDCGGHGQLAGNPRLTADVMERVSIGLSMMGATDFFKNYKKFRRLAGASSKARAALLRQGPSDPSAAMDAIDQRFYQLGGAERVVEYGAAWLRSLPNLVLLSSDDMRREEQAILTRNPEIQARKAERAAAIAAAQAADPMYISARRLCAMKKMEFVKFTVGSKTEQPDTMLWGMHTDQGSFSMLFGPARAELQDRITGAVLAAVPVGR